MDWLQENLNPGLSLTPGCPSQAWMSPPSPAEPRFFLFFFSIIAEESTALVSTDLVPPSPTTNFTCVTLSKTQNLSGFQFPHLGKEKAVGLDDLLGSNIKQTENLCFEADESSKEVSCLKKQCPKSQRPLTPCFMSVLLRTIWALPPSSGGVTEDRRL